MVEFVEVAVKVIGRLFFFAGIGLVAEITFHFAIKHNLEHRNEDFFESRLYFGYTFGLVLGRLGNSSAGCVSIFPFHLAPISKK